MVGAGVGLDGGGLGLGEEGGRRGGGSKLGGGHGGGLDDVDFEEEPIGNEGGGLGGGSELACGLGGLGGDASDASKFGGEKKRGGGGAAGDRQSSTRVVVRFRPPYCSCMGIGRLVPATTIGRVMRLTRTLPIGPIALRPVLSLRRCTILWGLQQRAWRLTI